MADRSVRIANGAKVTMRAHTRHAPRANSGKRRQFPPGAAGRMLCSAPTEIPIGGVGPTRRTTSERHCWGPELIVRLEDRDDNTSQPGCRPVTSLRSRSASAEAASRMRFAQLRSGGRRDTRVPKQDTGAPSPTHGGFARCFTGHLLGPAVDSGDSVYNLPGPLRSTST